MIEKSPVIGIQFQHTALQDFLTVRDTLRLFASLYPNPLPQAQLIELCALGEFISHGKIDGKAERQAVSDYVRLFNIKTPSQDQLIKLLSGGNQQKVAIAKGLLTRPKVLILDEPTRGVDVGAKKEIYQLINQFKKEGMSIILVSSEMPEVLGMSDRIVVLHEGRVTGILDRAEADQVKIMELASR